LAYFVYQFTDADGSSSGSVAPDENPVAITFPIANPDTDVTGIGPGLFGLNITTHTDFEMNDVSAGFGAPVNFFGPSLQTNVFIGGRVINIDRTDDINQSFREFPDVFQHLSARQDTYLYGMQFGLSAEHAPPLSENGITFGFGGSASFFASHTDGKVGSSAECPICPNVDDRDITLRVTVDDGVSSLAVDGQAFVGYRFGQAEIRLFANVTHLTDAPYIALPVNPAEALRIEEDDLTSATVGARFKIELGQRLKSVATTSVGF
jgi:hypothetical protein